MLIDFLYEHPTWEIGLLVIAAWCGLSLLGLVIFHRFVALDVRRRDTETVGLTFAIVAVIYAVLIAVIVVGVWERFAKSDEIVTAEANKLSNLALDAAGLPAAIAAIVHTDLDNYVDAVTRSEWPSQQAGHLDETVFEPGWMVLGHLSAELAGFEPATLGQNTVKAQMLSTVSQLIQARRGRILAAAGHLPPVIWHILLLAGALAVVYTYLFGAHSFALHLTITGLISASIALVFVLIIELDYPFRGEVSVSDGAFIGVTSTTDVIPVRTDRPDHAE